MATNLIRFEIVLPQEYAGTPQQNAISQFIQSAASLTDLVMYTAYIFPKGSDGTLANQQNCIYGLLTAAQEATALGYLNTLNAALGQNVICTVNQVTQEP